MEAKSTSVRLYKLLLVRIQLKKTNQHKAEILRGIGFIITQGNGGLGGEEEEEEENKEKEEETEKVPKTEGDQMILSSIG